ncbi:phosphonopyruvate decarboxylase [uncultured Methanobrevibacter sp.]|uniref:phosphonopyruvate decarboxylase n=1 Tax=uncultured Methanobrevibacter sp. TaxID=253161 RepID=UPI00258B3613|nr:phosphonopyruvate decarboxylase [uncultured Methanobrevibacter sp.]
MISPKFFIDKLEENNINFFTGVPDSLLKNICAYIEDNKDENHNIIAANEGAAMGLATGHYLATGEIPVVYMQNSGEGNIINPLASLTDKEVYNIPILLIIGWRGRPGVHDEPQHIKQGKVTLPLLETMEIKYTILSKDENEFTNQLNDVIEYMAKTKESFAFVVEKDTFEDYKLQNNQQYENLEMSREEAIQIVANSLDENTVIVSTTGMISRELFEYRANSNQTHEKDFLTVGSMGHASQIALGIALEKSNHKIYCFDGDGATIMHMGSMAIIGSKHPENYIHIIFNNGAHDSVGGQPTVGLQINIPEIAKALNYKKVFSIKDRMSLKEVLNKINDEKGPIMLEIQVKKGNRKDLGRPTTTPIQNKESLMKFLEK